MSHGTHSIAHTVFESALDDCFVCLVVQLSPVSLSSGHATLLSINIALKIQKDLISTLLLTVTQLLPNMHGNICTPKHSAAALQRFI